MRSWYLPNKTNRCYYCRTEPTISCECVRVYARAFFSVLIERFVSLSLSLFLLTGLAYGWRANVLACCAAPVRHCISELVYSCNRYLVPFMILFAFNGLPLFSLLRRLAHTRYARHRSLRLMRIMSAPVQSYWFYGSIEAQLSDGSKSKICGLTMPFYRFCVRKLGTRLFPYLLSAECIFSNFREHRVTSVPSLLRLYRDGPPL